MKSSKIVAYFSLLVFSFSLLAVERSFASATLPVQSDLVVWFDSADVNTLIKDSKGYVSVWKDKSGNNYDAVQKSTKYMPSYGIRSLNGISVLHFDGGDLLKTPKFSNIKKQPNTIFVVAKFDKSGERGFRPYLYDGINRNYRHALFSNSKGDFSWAGAKLSLGGSISLTPAIFTTVFNAHHSETFIDGKSIVKGYLGSRHINGLTLGSIHKTDSRLDNKARLKGYIAEIIMYDRMLEVSELTQVHNYLSSKWGIKISDQSSLCIENPKCISLPENALFVSPGGNDNNSGTKDKPWKTIKHAVNQLRAGDTLVIREGVYRESDILIGVSGTKDKPIVIKAYPGEIPIIDGGFSEFRKVDNADWEVVDAKKNIYRSVKTYPKNINYVHAYLGEDNGGYHIVAYEDYVPFSSNNEDYLGTKDYYIGPGVYFNKDDQKIYVRLQHSKYQGKDEMNLSYPTNVDPRKTKLYVFPENEIIRISSDSSYIKLESINFSYGGTALRFLPGGANNIIVKNSSIKAGRYFIRVQEHSHNILFDNIIIDDKVPQWIAWSDVKRPSSGRPGHRYQGAGITIDGHNVEIKNSTFRDTFDAINFTNKAHDIHIHHNEFYNIRDDVTQMGSAGYNYNIHHNKLIGVHAGFSWHGSGDQEPGYTGTKYIHHNIIDASQYTFKGRSDPHNLLSGHMKGADGTGYAAGSGFGSHSMSGITTPDPWKIYHNTVISGKKYSSNNGMGNCYHYSNFGPEQLNSNFPHEMYNNIFVELEEQHILGKCQIKGGSHILDGNLYHRTDLSAPVFKELYYGDQKISFSSLSDFKKSSYFVKTKSYYNPGWEASGIEADPKLNSEYIPDKYGPAAKGALDLSNKKWPGLKGETFRGALQPQ